MENSNKKTIKKKVALLGDASVGKTSLARRFVLNQFDEKYITSIGANVSKKVCELESCKVELIIYDLFGQHIKYQQIPLNLIKGAEGFLLVGDVTRKESFDNLKGYWSNLIKTYYPEYQNIYKTNSKLPAILLANKIDLPNVEVKTRDLEELCSEIQKYKELDLLKWYYTSAKTGVNVNDAFESLAKKLVI